MVLTTILMVYKKAMTPAIMQKKHKNYQKHLADYDLLKGKKPTQQYTL
jgi:hypothetical protein